MPTAKLGEVEIYYEETGTGTPLVWSHEFGGDYRSWEPQVRYFSRRYRVITYNHRGYPPSSVPTGAASYSQELLVGDLFRLLKHLGVGPVHLAGCSMGANAARDLPLAPCRGMGAVRGHPAAVDQDGGAILPEQRREHVMADLAVDRGDPEQLLEVVAEFAFDHDRAKIP